jgi:hypothetical protein
MAYACTCWFEIKSTISRISCKILFLSYLSLVGVSRSLSDYCITLFISDIINSMLFWDIISNRNDLWFYTFINNSFVLFLYLRGKVVFEGNEWRCFWEDFLGYLIGKFVCWLFFFDYFVEKNRIHWEIIDLIHIFVILINCLLLH